MPLYTYACEECGKRFDRIASYVDVNTVCRFCSGVATRAGFYSSTFRMEDAEVPKGDPEWNDSAKKRLKKDRDYDYDRALEHISKHIKDTDHGKVLDMEAM